MTLFVLAITTVIGVSFLCSLAEAALYSVSPFHVRRLESGGSRAGKLLGKFKANMDAPVAAILILNTFAHTAGAALAGFQFSRIFPSQSPLLFAILMTLAVLYISEIIPKVLGVTYNRSLSRMLAPPLQLLIVGLSPFVWISKGLTRLLPGRGDKEPVAPEEEVLHMAAMSAEEGSILPIEAHIIENVLRLDRVTAGDIMTPRTVVFSLPAETTLKELSIQGMPLRYSRVPLYTGGDPENLTGVVHRADVYTHLAKDDFAPTLGSVAKPIRFVPESMAAHTLLREFLTERKHMFGVVDEYGGLEGIVTLEDVLEELIGQEIVDESDLAVDMQELARRIAKAKGRG